MHPIWVLRLEGCVLRRYATHGRAAMFAQLGDAYQTLGVGRESTGGEIKWRYYQLCRELHPDAHRTGSDAKPASITLGEHAWHTLGDEGRRRLVSEQFASVVSAYKVLSDAEVRREYDEYRKQLRHPARILRADPWAAERPAPHGEKSREQRLADRRLTAGVFGLLGGMMVVSWAKRQALREDELRLAELRHRMATNALEDAHRRAREKWREAPPGHVMEYEAARLAPAVGRPDELWPQGAGLGLLAVLHESQLCGVRARAAVGGADIARHRARTQRALQEDSVVSRYMALAEEG
ncbi:hypothetical protein H4S07_003954 [Coemansia furcata]|uniref:Uncharacterized protein n=1 Tax=Coemansia furcata TaxID=417177 RepID=A0ACC1LD40_9FUNG|nr:hypothetical protein H4S07_003954 [Coemansia furcata]